MKKKRLKRRSSSAQRAMVTGVKNATEDDGSLKDAQGNSFLTRSMRRAIFRHLLSQSVPFQSQEVQSISPPGGLTAGTHTP